MAGLNFQSVGGQAGNAIQQFLMQREAQNRQRMLDDLLKQKEANDVDQQEKDRAMRAQDLALRQAQEQRVADAQRAAMEDLSNQREFSQVERAVEGARPDDAPLDADMAEKVQRQGFGSRLRQIPGVLMQGPMESGDESMRAEEVGQTPEQTALRPGSRYLDAEAQRTFLEEQAEQTRIAAGERAADSNALRMAIAELNARGDANSKALANQLAGLNIQLAQGKVDDAAKERKRTEDARTNDAENAIELLDRLESHPGLDAATGAYEMRGLTQEARSWRSIANSVVAALSLPNMSSLKGPASDKDVAFIKEKSTILQNPNISGEDARQAIRDAREFLRTGRIPQVGGAPTAPAGGGKGFKVVGVR